MKRSTELQPIAIEVPPFPRLVWDGFSWAGQAALPSWRGWRNRVGLRGGAARIAAPVSLTVVHPLLVEDSPRHLPSSAQRIGYEHLMANERAIAEAAQRALWTYARPEIEIARADLAEQPHLPQLPAVRSRDDLRRLAQPTVVYVLEHVHAGMAYVGIQLACAW